MQGNCYLADSKTSASAPTRPFIAFTLGLWYSFHSLKKRLLGIILANELVPVNLLVLVLIASVLLASPTLRIILGLPVLLLAPGYALVAALFPRSQGPDALERLALSFGLSIAVVPIIGLVLKFTPLGLELEPVLYSVSSFVFITSIVAGIRRYRLPEQERFCLNFRLKAPNWRIGKLNMTLSIVLVATIAGALGMLAYMVLTPVVGEKFTEFYVLGSSGKTTEYPVVATVGNKSEITVVVVNREQKVTNYQLEVNLVGLRVAEVKSIILANQQKWEQKIGFVPDKVGDDQRLELLLYKDGEAEPYRTLYLMIDVKG